MDAHMVYRVIGVALLFLLVLAAGYLLRDKSALRDISNGGNKPYSLGRVQLWWWSLIIIAMAIISFMFSGKLPDLNTTCLALLGISLGTTVSGRVIDNTDQSRGGGTRHQDAESKGLFTDIMSDSEGISVHRFQSVAFNVIYGLTFIVYVIEKVVTSPNTQTVFPDYDTTTLGILLASSSAYVAVKVTENLKKN